MSTTGKAGDVGGNELLSEESIIATLMNNEPLAPDMLQDPVFVHAGDSRCLLENVNWRWRNPRNPEEFVCGGVEAVRITY